MSRASPTATFSFRKVGLAKWSHRLVKGNLTGPRLTVDGTHIRLTYAQHRILVVLVQAAGAPVPRELLLRAIRPTSDELGSNATLDAHICRLRAKVAIAGIVLETIKTVGYALRVTSITALDG